ncbi:ninja-family protein AFP2 [Neltuma alba]|uniref:ninja-family protein AFP2 n=1 Tax=Neltuma alba TaxID=207710 RepID=UPI0010A31B48|nr:ninja-family protein AFP2-like [Prosopis alba]
MGEANEGRRSKAMDNMSLQMDKFPRDLLQRFMACSNNTQQPLCSEACGQSEEIELSLGLSLGGRFGVDKNAKKLMRSSSIVGTMPFVREDTTPSPSPARANPTTLMRTSSLPAETEEQWRKRKELQTLRRMEAKRRRSEKQRNSKTERDGGSGGAGGATVSARPFGLPSCGASSDYNARQVQVVLGDVLAKGKVGFQGYAQPSSQGSADSQGGSSSGVSEMDSKPFQGSSSCGEARSPASNHPLQEQSKQDLAGSSGAKTNDNVIRTSRAEPEHPAKKPDSCQKQGREIGISSMEDMPCVFAKGDGPNGRRIEGILYRYGKGEEVRIMCVCHGKFLSPAEFVKHAGGGDVSHPLRHIVVNPVHTPFL